MDVVHIFSRQVEYSEDNIENLYEDFIFDDIFKTDSLIAILWIDSENI
jgi:lysine-N-methylase